MSSVPSIVSVATRAASSVASASASASASSAPVHEQGGVIDGLNPSKYDASNPIILFIIQAGLIIIVCHLLHWPLAKIRQPRVIAEVVGGIILGPSVLGRIPGFQAALFPEASIPNLNNVANLGLVLYLFLIGLETDVRFLVSNWRIATSVAVAGLALPFGIGCALAYGVYNAFHNEPGLKPIAFSIYMLFIGIAVAITAFPVLCRILTELKLLDTSVGVVTLSAGVANDVVGWILLALCVALVNAGTGLNALWILLASFGFVLALLFAVQPALGWILRRNGSIENGPSQSVISFILLIALAAAFFTGIIGIHPIFGSFMAGLIIPRDERFNIHVTEKLEDLIGALFLPLYFTLSGLKTNLGLLDTGAAWGYVFAVTFAAFFSKTIGASMAARFSGMVWRESLTIGVLMSCKGLVELIVLNIGLQAKILSTRTFTIFVVMALLTTFATTPIVSVLYPPWYQKKIAAWKRGEIDWETGAPISPPSSSGDSKGPPEAFERVNRLLVYLRLDNMASLLQLLCMFGDPCSSQSPITAATDDSSDKTAGVSITTQSRHKAVWAHGIRLLQLTDRDSSVMTVAQVDDYTRHDPVVKTFRTVGQLHNLAASGEVAIMPESRYAEALAMKFSAMSSDLLLLPWTETGSMGDDALILSSSATTTTVDDKIGSSYGTFVKSVLDSPDMNVAVFFSRTGSPSSDSKGKANERAANLMTAYSFGGSVKEDIPIAPLPNRPYHIFLVYFGDNDDDKLALRLVLQLCEKCKATATILRARRAALRETASSSAAAAADENENVDVFDRAFAQLSETMARRVKFETAAGVSTMEDLLQHALSETNSDAAENMQGPKLVVVGRRDGGAALDEGKGVYKVREELQACLGSLAGSFVAGGVRADVLVVQAKSVR
ncbi:related to potassium:hydrogen antiporter [Claviceps purpurea 20.1]|uniref:Related to potassium:hydrogen antiporter n=1 Tax=Claviceps purpurea (strain 20.1) TaxID=1111077 RepID=M1WBB2_CLAP2|nr:related to potassium:hydrogen antiporter [Claviceps purpurea 20.1]